MAFAPAIMAGVGIASSIGGQIAAGVSKRKQAELESKAIQEASEQEILATEVEIGQLREQGAKVQSAQRAGYGKGGVLLEGSPLKQIVETGQKVEEDVFWKRQNLKSRLKQLRTQGLSALQGGQASSIATGFGVAGSLFSGIANLPGVWGK